MESILHDSFQVVWKEIEDLFDPLPGVKHGALSIWQGRRGTEEERRQMIIDSMPDLLVTAKYAGLSALSAPSDEDAALGGDKASHATNGRGALPEGSADLEELRALMISRHVAREADRSPEVRGFRERYFGKTTKRMSWRNAQALLSGRDLDPRTDDLARTAHAISRRYGWSAQDAAQFLLTGYALVHPVTSASFSVTLVAGPRANVTVTAQSFAPPRLVMEIFAAQQKRLFGHRKGRPIAESNLRLFDFVGLQMAKLGRPPQAKDWPMLWAKWKLLAPAEAPHSSPSRIKTDYERTLKLLFPLSFVSASLPGSRVVENEAGEVIISARANIARTKRARGGRR